jgi:hypothetical protein
MRGTVLRAVKVACIVTPVLTVLNHAPEITAGQFSAGFWLQAGLTFLVPYCVSTYSSAMSAIAERRLAGASAAEQVPRGES